MLSGGFAEPGMPEEPGSPEEPGLPAEARNPAWPGKNVARFQIFRACLS